MLAVNPISSVRFGEGSVALDREGAFAKPKAENSAMQQPVQDEVKKSGTAKKIVGTILGLAAVAGALAALPKVCPNAIRVLSKDELAAKPGFAKTLGHYVAVIGNKIAEYTYEPIVKLFKGKKPKVEPQPDVDPQAAASIFA